ncbi:MAG: efflux RND transporter periplasmic adaptor subunit [bacterium]|nr:efflux RND transporter periplasmic adaptor subunit [bacterium]
MKREILQRSRLSLTPLFVFAPALLALGLVACGGKEAENNQSAAVPAALELAPIDVATVRRGTLSGGLPITGTLQAVVQTTVQSRVAAEVGTVLVREGERVQKGQVLAHLGTLDIDARLKQAQANLAAAKVEAALSRGLVGRNKQLYDKQYFPEIEYQRSVGDAEAREENVRAQQALVDIAGKALNDASVRAPMSGIVSRRYVEPGSSVGMDGKLFDIVDLSEMELEAPVPVTDIAQVKAGQRVVFTVSGFDQRSFEGKVLRINPVADAGTRAISAYVRIRNPDGFLKGGMFVRGTVGPASSEPGLIVPLAAIHREAGKASTLFVLKNDRLELRQVTLGAVDERASEAMVSAGVQEGETVVLVNLSAQAANSPAKVVTAGQ